MGESLGDAVLRLVVDSAPLKREMGAAHAFTLGRIKSMAVSSKAAMAAGIAGAAVAVGVGLTKVGESFDSAFDKITAKTGAVGKRLEGLKDDFREVFRTVPNSADEVSTAIGELHRRLDLVGKPLQERSRQFLTLSRITGTDLETNIKAGARAFQDWEVPVKRQGATLDGFLAISQKTGASVEQLLTSVVQFGAPLRNFGFSIDQAAAMFAGFEEAGVNMTTTMSGMRLGVGNLADPTDDLKQRLKDLGLATAEPQEQFLGIIDAMGKAKTEQEALGVAIDVFGRRAANDMKEAVKQGRFEVDDLMQTFRRGKGAIADTAEETDDWRESLATLRNKGMLAIEKPAMAMITALTFLAEGAGVAFDAFDRLPEPIKAAALALGILAVAARLNPWVTLVAGTIALVGIVKHHWPEVKRVIDAVLDWLRTAFDDVKKWFTRTFGPAFRWLSNAWRDVRDVITGVWNTIVDGIVFAVDKILGLFSTMMNAVADVVEELGRIPIIGDKFEGLADGIRSGANAIDELRESMRGEEETRRKVERGLGDLEKTARTKLGKTAGITERSMDRVKTALAKGSKQGVDALAREYDRAIDHIRRAMKKGEIEHRKGLQLIERLMMKQLRVYGVKDPKSMLAKADLGGRGGGGSPAGRKRGGGIPIPGVGEGDTVPVHVAGVHVANTEPHERMFILNRNASGALDRLQSLNRAVPRQAGGFVDLWGRGIAHLQTGGLAPEAANLARQMVSKFGGSISSGLRPGDDGFHGSGQAFDWVGGDWARAAAYMNAIGPNLLEGIYNPADFGGAAVSWDSGAKVPSSFWGASTWDGHRDHIHGAIAKMIEGVMAGRIELPRFVALAQAASAHAQGLNNISAALEDRLNAATGGIGDDGFSFPPGGGDFLSTSYGPPWNAMNGTGVTATGVDLTSGPEAYGVAVDPDVIPLGSKLRIQPNPFDYNGLFRAFDTGGAIQGNRIDFYDWRGRDAQLGWGERRVNVEGFRGGGLVDAVRGFAKGGIVDLVDAFVGQYKGTEGAGDRRKLISETAKRIKESKQLGVDKLTPDGSALAGGLEGLRAQADQWGEWASHAGALTTTDAEGNDIPGVFQDRDEAGWLGEQLGALFALRNALVTASESLEKVRERVRKMVDDAKKQLEKVQKAIKDGEKERRQLEKERRKLEKRLEDASAEKERNNRRIERELEQEQAKPKGKRNEARIKDLRERLRSPSSEKDAIRDDLRRNTEAMAGLEEKQLRRGQLRDALKGPISDALGTRIQAVHSGQTTLADELNFVQGTGFDTEWMPSLPDLGGLGGEIFDVQLQLRELGAVEPEIDAEAEPAEAEETGFSIAELMDLAEAIRFGVFDQDLAQVSGMREGGVRELTREMFASERVSQMPALHGGGVVGAGGDFGGTDEVIRRLLPEEGVIDQQTMRDGITLPGGRYRFVVENWEQGRGYFERVADNRIDEADRESAGRYRAGVPS